MSTQANPHPAITNQTKRHYAEALPEAEGINVVYGRYLLSAQNVNASLDELCEALELDCEGE